MSATNNQQTLYEHQIYCITQQSWEYQWTDSEEPITKCPVDTNHEVQPGSEFISNVRSPNTVVVDKEPMATTSGIGRVETVKISAPARSTGRATKSWPYQIAIYSLTAGVPESAVGCALSLNANPDAYAGLLRAPVGQGDTVLVVDPEAIAAIVPGQFVSLRNRDTYQSLGEAVEIDAKASTVTVEIAATEKFPESSEVLVTTSAAEAMEFPLAGYVTFGQDRSVARMIKKGVPLEFVVDNPTDRDTAIVVYISYNY